MSPSRLLAAGLLLLMGSVRLGAQESTGTITGLVRDASGSSVAGASITATQSETGLKRTAQTGTDGAYVFPNLPIGNYRLSATHSGFKTSIQEGIELHVSERLGRNLTLEVGDMTQAVTVEASADGVRTESGEQGGLISGEQVRELQLNGRSFFTLLELIPGVASNLGDRTDPNSTPDLAINGSRNSASNFSIDGGNNADLIVGSGSMNTFTSIETIAEFNVITTPFSAEYGRSGFSQVNVVTKGGSKQYKIGLFHFLRNDALDATDYFSHQTLPLKLNNFGYNIGGPVSLFGYNRDRRRTFFFFAQEFNRIRTKGEAENITVPGASERTGDFSGLGPGRDGEFGTTDDPVIDPDTGGGFPNGRIPASRIDPNSSKLIALYPLPNFVGPGAINFTSAAASRQNYRSDSLRVDHIFTDKFKLYGRYTQDSLNMRNPYGGTAITSVTTAFPGLAVTEGIRPGKNIVINGTHLPNYSFLQQFQFTLGRRITDVRPAVDNSNANRKALGLTLPELFPENDGDVIPGITLGSGLAAIAPFRVAHKELFNLEFSDTFAKMFDRHSLRFGAYYNYGGNLEQPSNVNTGGTFTFTTNFTRNSIANFLLGLPNTYTEVERPVVSDVRFGALEAFILDEFRPLSNLTVNLGLRYTSYFNPYDIQGVATNFVPSLWDPAKIPQVVRSNGALVRGTGDPLNGIVTAGRNSPYGRGIANDLHGIFAPRFGFAYAPGRRRMSFRGGWGMFYTRPLIGAFINNAFNNPPFSRTVTLNQPSYRQLAGPEAASTVPALTTLGLPLKTPVSHSFAFSVEREVTKRNILNVAYVGTRGIRLLRPININDALPGTVTTGTNIHFLRPYHGYGAITERQSSGSSIYHSLQVSYRRNMISRKLLGGIAYTWSKSIDNGSSDRDAGDVPPNRGDTRAERGPSNFDRTHVFTGNFIYMLPAIVKSPAFRGWELSGITRMWSGRPFDVILSSDVAQIGAVQNQRPDVIGNGTGPGTVEEWFNRGAFARPRTGTFGNMGRNSLRMPGVNKWDLAIYKNFMLAEQRRLQFRFEFFNALNHPVFDTVGTTVNTTATGLNPGINNFGVVTGTRDARVAQLGLKLYLY